MWPSLLLPPQGIVRDNGGHAVALKWSMRAIMDTHPGDLFFAASDVGWVVVSQSVPGAVREGAAAFRLAL